MLPLGQPDAGSLMAEMANRHPEQDAARAETELPLTPEDLFAFVADSERLFRLNPHLAIDRWQARPDGFYLDSTNETNGRRLETMVQVKDEPGRRTFHYGAGLKQATILAIEPTAAGARLILTDLYPRLADPGDSRVEEVDRSLVPWVAAVRRHLLARQRWGWLPGWHWWREGLLTSLPPRHRRIVRLLLWISLGEFFVFLGLVLSLG